MSTESESEKDRNACDPAINHCGSSAVIAIETSIKCKAHDVFEKFLLLTFVEKASPGKLSKKYLNWSS